MSEELIREYEELDEDESGGSGSEDENSRSNRDNRVELSDTEETKKGDDDKKDKDKPDKERRRSTKPRVTLNDRILKNPKKGITKIETYFENFNFLGKGHEKEDLDRVMKRLEHWSHRLFPMYNFDDFLEKTEQIGLKRLMSAYVEKYRTDMLEDDIVVNEEDEPSMPVVADDPFDDLLLEHAPIRRQMSQAPKVPLSDEVKERMERNRLLALEKKKAREAERQRQAEEARMQNLDSGIIESQDSVPIQHEEKEVEMSLEERIEMKRQMALAKKLARQKEMEQSKAAESQVVDEQIQDMADESLTVVEKDCQLYNQKPEDLMDENLGEGSKDQQVEEPREEEKGESMEVTEEVDGSSEKMDV